MPFLAAFAAGILTTFGTFAELAKALHLAGLQVLSVIVGNESSAVGSCAVQFDDGT